LGKVEQTNNPSAGLQGIALILFNFYLISEAQPHSSNSSSLLIFQFPHFLISSFPGIIGIFLIFCLLGIDKK